MPEAYGLAGQKLFNGLDMDFERLSKLAGISEGFQVVPKLDADEYPNRESQGLEGPFRLKSGLVVYYDAREGKYYNPKTDIYLTHEEYQQLTESGEEDGSGVTDAKITQLVTRYHRARNPRTSGIMVAADIKREQDDVFDALTALVGGPQNAVRYLLSSPLRESSLTEAMITNTLPQRDNQMNFERMKKLAGLDYVNEGYGLTDERAAEQIAAKLQGTPNLTLATLKQYVIKYLGMVGKNERDVPMLLGLVHDLLGQKGMLGDEKPGTNAHAFAAQSQQMNRPMEGVEEEEAARLVAESEKTPEEEAPKQAVKVQTLAQDKDFKKLRVPADVSAAITTRISELKAAIEQFDEKGYNDQSVKVNAIEALEKIADNFKKEDGLLKANVFYNTLMSPIQDLLPNQLIKFLHTAPKSEKVKEGAEEPNPSSRCADCDDKIDPRNYDRTARGFLCLPCADERRQDTRSHIEDV